MVFSKNLLAQFLPDICKITDNQLIDACGAVGMELEKIYKHPKLDNNVVIGKLIAIKKHENADNLSICTVAINSSKTLTIVTGAPNLILNKNVVVALNGAKLHNNIIIKNRELRGIMSEGMMCSYQELTPHNHDFIAKNDVDTILMFDDGEIGDTNVQELLQLDDTIYDIAIPFSNRNDLNGVLAFLQEIAGYFNFKLTYPTLKKNTSVTPTIPIKINFDVANGGSFLKINNIKLKESDWKLKGLLMNNHLKPLNTVLDQLNYITLLTNIPSAAYDSDKIKDIEINLAKKGETFTGFDQKKYSLTTDDIVIRSDGEIICLAGILGDNKYGVNEQTKNIIVELANFNYQMIRNTATKLNITTDAARRFSKINSTYCSRLAAQLCYQYFNKKSIEWSIDRYKENSEQCINNVNFDTINIICGTNFTPAKIKKILKPFGFNFKLKKCIIPAYRNDIHDEYDLAEEVVKSLHVNEIEHQSIEISGVDKDKITEYYFYSSIRDILYYRNISECRTYNTINNKMLDPFNIFNYQKNIKIISSNNANREYLRTNLIHSLLNVYKYNIEHNNPLIPIFEIQKIYQANQEFGEYNLTILTPNKYFFDRTNNSQIIFNINGLYGVLNELLNRVFENENINIEASNSITFLYKNETVSIKYENKIIGYIGKLTTTALKPFDINEPIYLLTINLNDLLKSYSSKKFILQPINKKQLVQKDITIDCFNKKQSLAPIINQIAALNYIKNVEFVGKFINETKYTYTIHLTFNPDSDNSREKINENLVFINKLINDYLKN